MSLRRPLFLLAILGAMPLFAGDAEVRGDGSLPGPGTVVYEMTREGAWDADLRVQGLVLGHRPGKSPEALLQSPTVEVIPAGPTRVRLEVTEEKFRQWSREFHRLSTGLRVVPRPGDRRQWEYENLLDPKKDKRVTGQHLVRGRWKPHSSPED